MQGKDTQRYASAPDKILIVDDQADNLYSLECILAEEGRVIIKAQSGEEALKLALKEDFSLILLDVQMPVMDGFEVARILKSGEKTKSVPLLFVTAISKERNFVIQGLNEGAVDYLFKPLDIDITRAKANTLLLIHRQQKELVNLNAELKRLNTEKNYFLGMASHDLRNPISNILTLSTILERDATTRLDDEEQDYLRHIISTSRHMLELLGNLLDISKIETGRIQPERKHLQLQEVIQESIRQNQPSASTKNICVTYSLPDKPDLLYTDRLHLLQVLNNLLSNALKFSFPGSAVEIMAEQSHKEIIIHVIDQGLGIPEDDQAHLFTPFNRNGNKGTGGEKSTGLGLHIARKLIEANGGRIWMKSKKGEGSVFSIAFPRAETRDHFLRMEMKK